jgi:hypothetical protein
LVADPLPWTRSLALDLKNPRSELNYLSQSTQKGFSLFQLEALSQKLGLRLQMAYRENDGAFVVPSVVHLKVERTDSLTTEIGSPSSRSVFGAKRRDAATVRADLLYLGSGRL